MIRKILVVMMCVAAAMAVLSGCGGKTVQTEDLKKTAVDSFSSIHLDVNVAAVEIIPEAGKFAIEYHLVNQKVSYSVNGGILTLNAEDAGGINISYNENSYVKIYVPEGGGFTDIDCKCNVGDIRIGKMKADNVKIDSNVGNVILTDADVAKKLAIEAAVGNVDVEIAAADCSYDISTDVGKIVINGTEFSGMGVEKVHNSPYGPQVKISAGTGDISFRY